MKLIRWSCLSVQGLWFLKDIARRTFSIQKKQALSFIILAGSQ